MEQREIKVCLLHTSMLFLFIYFLVFHCFYLPGCVFPSVLFIHPPSLMDPPAPSLTFTLSSSFLVSFYCAATSSPMFSFNSFLFALMAVHHLHIAPFFTSIRLFLLLLSSVYFSGEYKAGRMSVPRCTSGHRTL